MLNSIYRPLKMLLLWRFSYSCIISFQFSIFLIVRCLTSCSIILRLRLISSRSSSTSQSWVLIFLKSLLRFILVFWVIKILLRFHWVSRLQLLLHHLSSSRQGIILKMRVNSFLLWHIHLLFLKSVQDNVQLSWSLFELIFFLQRLNQLLVNWQCF